LPQTKIWNFFDLQPLKAGYSKRLNLKNKHKTLEGKEVPMGGN
jgi:hypothetical protein